MMRQTAALLMTGMVLLACSDGTSQPQLEPSVRMYAAAYLGGDAGGSFNMLSERCKTKIGRDQFAAVVAAAHSAYAGASITSYTERRDGQTALASYSLTVPELNQTDERWIVEQGAWRNDDCP